MRIFFSIALTAAFALAFPASGRAQQSTARHDSVTRKITELQRQLDSLRSATEQNTKRLIEMDEAGSASVARTARGDSARRSIPSTAGIYGKPFVRRFGSGTAIGGYVDLEFSTNFTTKARSFDQHRLVPFIYSEITDRLHFGTEIEFEHGVKIENADGEAEGAGEINVEFATMDYRFFEGLNLRGGVILSPLGRFNLVHDSPLNEL
ncbi:MAG TPA: hypothetical protein VHM24_03430, partial [Gemmatimonadaceae bacterium]|nr:hypothetical protein [Gemmatimonadaceae bacterium]